MMIQVKVNLEAERDEQLSLSSKVAVLLSNDHILIAIVTNTIIMLAVLIGNPVTSHSY